MLLAFHEIPLSPINLPPRQSPMSLDLPLLRLPQVTVLRTDYSLIRNVILRLTDREDVILPNLKCYSFDIKIQPTSSDLAAPETLTCLRSRFKNGSPFALQYWTPDGEAKYDTMFQIYADTG